MKKGVTDVKCVLFCLVLAIVSSCGRGKDIDVSSISVDVTIKRLERTLDTIPKEKIEENIPFLIEEYGDFLELYSVHILNVGSVYKANYAERLGEFYDYEFYGDIQNAIIDEFADFSQEKEDIVDAFKHYKHYFPSNEIPTIYTYMGGMQQSVVVGDGLVGIGLDKYLGIQSPFYKQMQIEQFKKKKMYRERIVADCMAAVAEGEFEFNFEDRNLLANLIHEGRKMYFVKKMIPSKADSVVWGFTGNEVVWLENSESSMWDYMVANDQLFSSDYMLIKRYVGDGPFIPQFSKDSPGKAPVWVGYRIVEGYMDNNPEITLAEMMSESDYQKILKKSKYNP